MIATAHEEHGMVVRRIAGRGARAPELVWLHGLGERSRCFDRVVALLDGFTHVLPDLPGYGDSQPPVMEAGDSLVATAAHLAEWLSSWPTRAAAPVLVGHSMGGVLATLVAEKVAVGGVVNVDGNLSRGDCTFSAIAAGQPLEAFAAGGFAAMRGKVAADGATDAALRGYADAMGAADAAVFHRNARDLVALSVPEQLVARFAALAVPVLFIAGVPGGICERSRSLLDAHHLPWAGIEPAGHWPFIDQPELFAATLRAFVRELEERAT